MKPAIRIFCFCVILLFTTVSRAADKPKNVCFIQEGEKQMTNFNFTKISNQKMDDYKIEINDSSEIIYLQLCKPLQRKCHGQENYSICLTKHGKEIGLGTFPPAVSTETFQTIYKFTGDKCNKDAANYTTIVTMQCDYKKANDSNPIVTEKNECEIHILWFTSLACGDVEETNCSITDEKGFKYDLITLTKFSDNYEIPVTNSSTKILLNVCHSLIFGHGMSCVPKAGSCLVNSTAPSENGKDLGEVTSKSLSIIKEDHLRLHYTTGTMCSVAGIGHFETIIDFICDHNAENSHPKYINNTCTYYIEWKTPLACKSPPQHKLVTRTQESVEKKSEIMAIKKEEPPIKSEGNNQVNCSVTTEKGKIDLSPLGLAQENYIVKSKDSEFHINVCRPLSSSNFKSCEGKAVCRIQRDGNGRILKETSLGTPGDNPIDLKKENVILNYKSGAACQENNKDTISTNITFKCDYFAKKSSPQFDKYTNCTYLFTWDTMQVCESVIGNFYNNCTISNPLSRKIDLSVLRDETFHIYSGNKNYSISICETKNLCNGSTICEGNNGLGKSINVVYQYPKDSVKLEFTKGSKCQNETFSSDITFLCNSSANLGAPILISKSSESPCHLSFEWQTKLVCMDNSKKPVPPNETKDTQKKAETASSNGQFLLGLITIVVVIVAVVMYLRDSSRRARCFRIVSSPCSSSSNDRVKYCRINTTEEARLLLDNCEPTTVCQSDSDDDLLGA